ncbi:hypothetical protein ACJWUX_23065 [Klebsiella pneumoniae]
MKRGLRYVRIKGFSVSKLGLLIPAEKIPAALPGMADGAFLGVSDSRRGAGASLPHSRMRRSRHNIQRKLTTFSGYSARLEIASV